MEEVWETFNAAFKQLARQERQMAELEQRLAEAEKRIAHLESVEQLLAEVA